MYCCRPACDVFLCQFAEVACLTAFLGKKSSFLVTLGKLGKYFSCLKGTENQSLVCHLILVDVGSLELFDWFLKLFFTCYILRLFAVLHTVDILQSGWY